MDNEPTEDESQDNGFSTKDAFILGGAMGWAIFVLPQVLAKRMIGFVSKSIPPVSWAGCYIQGRSLALVICIHYVSEYRILWFGFYSGLFIRNLQ